MRKYIIIVATVVVSVILIWYYSFLQVPNIVIPNSVMIRENKNEGIFGYDNMTIFKINDIEDAVRTCKSHELIQPKMFNDDNGFDDEIYFSKMRDKMFGLSQQSIFVCIYNVTDNNVGGIISKLQITQIGQRCEFEPKANNKYAIIHTSLYSSYINTWLTSR